MLFEFSFFISSCLCVLRAPQYERAAPTLPQARWSRRECFDMTAEREIVRGDDKECGKECDVYPGDYARPEGTCDAADDPKVGTGEPRFWRDFQLSSARGSLRTAKFLVRCSCTRTFAFFTCTFL